MMLSVPAAAVAPAKNWVLGENGESPLWRVRTLKGLELGACEGAP